MKSWFSVIQHSPTAGHNTYCSHILSQRCLISIKVLQRIVTFLIIDAFSDYFVMHVLYYKFDNCEYDCVINYFGISNGILIHTYISISLIYCKSYSYIYLFLSLTSFNNLQMYAILFAYPWICTNNLFIVWTICCFILNH